MFQPYTVIKSKDWKLEVDVKINQNDQSLKNILHIIENYKIIFDIRNGFSNFNMNNRGSNIAESF